MVDMGKAIKKEIPKCSQEYFDNIESVPFSMEIIEKLRMWIKADKEGIFA